MRLVLAIALVLASPPAHALSCAFAPRALLPAEGATDVPLNAVVRIHRQDDHPSLSYALRVGDASGATVPADWSREAGVDDAVVAITPRAPLAPFTEYVVVERWRAAEGDEPPGRGDSDDSDDTDAIGAVDDPWVFVRFTTGDAMDTTAPTAPELLGARKTRSPGWFPFFGPSASLRLVVATPREPVAYRLRIEEPSTGRVTRLWAGGWPIDAGRDEIRVGEGPCHQEYDVTMRPVRVTVEAFDQAGQAASRASMPASAGCRTTPGWPVFALSVLAGIATRRRQR